MLKKLTSLFLTIASIILLLPTGAFPVIAADTSSIALADIVDAAAEIIYQNEGSYSSVNRDDNGALSIGKLQWHGNRALNLLKTIVKANTTQAQTTLGTTLYNEIQSATAWTTRILTAEEATVVSSLISTNEGKAAQDALAKSDITSYVVHGMSLGITSPPALVFFADLENQCGSGGSTRVAGAAATLAGGSYSAINLDYIYNAALADSVAGKYPSRRYRVYVYVLSLGWEASDIDSAPYEIWRTNYSMSVRTGPDTSNTFLTTFATGTLVFITEMTLLDDGFIWGRCSLGWLALKGFDEKGAPISYCTYISGALPSKVTFDLAGGTLDLSLKATAAVNGINVTRLADYLVVFNENKGSTTGTNIYGTEAIVSADGKVTAIYGYGYGNNTIPKGGFVLSGIGTMTSWISQNIAVGNYVRFDKSNSKVNVFTSYDAYMCYGKTVKTNAVYGYLPTPVREGYVFEGWCSSDGNYVASDTVLTTNKDITLTASWTPIAYNKITYDTNGGKLSALANVTPNAVNTGRGLDQLILYTSGTTTGTNIYGTEVAVSASGLVTKINYYGTGNTAIPAGGCVLSGNGTMGTWLAAAATLDSYILYDVKTLAVAIYASKADYLKINKKVAQGSPVGVLPAVTRTNYEFTGWYTASGEMVSADTIYTYSGDITLTAGWKVIEGKITFHENGGVLDRVLTQTTAAGVNIHREENRLVVFNRIKGATTGTNIYGTEVLVSAEGLVTQINGYGTGNSPIPEGGFVLSGNGDMSVWLYTNLSVGNYVAFDANTCLVTIYRNYTAYLADGHKSVCYGSTYGTLPLPTRTGYTFTGWTTGDGTKITEASVVNQYGNFSLTASWEVIRVTVTLDPCGGVLDAGAKAVSTINGINIGRELNFLVIYNSGKGATTGTNIYGTEAIVEADGRVSAIKLYGSGNNAIPKDGFVISGNGTMSTWIKDNVAEGDYARFDKDTNTLLIYTKSAHFMITSKTLAYGSAYGYLPVPVYEGHTFSGWYTVQSNQVEEATPMLALTDHTLYARWSTDTYTITYNANGGEGAPGTVEFAYKTPVTISDITPQRTCAIFLGWSNTPDGAAIYQPGDTYTGGSIILYAVWDTTHDYTDACTSTITGQTEEGCIVSYTCPLCGYTGTFLLPFSEIRTDVEAVVTGLSGTTATAVLNLSGSVSLQSFTMTVLYDTNALTYTGFSNGSVVADGAVSITETEPGNLSVTASVSGGFTADGTLSTLSFFVKNNPTGSVISAENASGLCVAGWDGLFNVSVNTIFDYPKGDLNGDGEISAKDSMVLKRYLAGYPVTLFNGDLNGDGDVSAKDSMLLKRYLAGYEDVFN